MRWASRCAVLGVAVVINLTTFALPATAHATLVATLPEAGYSVTEAPQELGLVFDERVSLDTLRVEGQARGDVRTTAPHVSPDGMTISARPATPLPEGRYTVSWRVIGLDGHEIEGTFGFGVGAEAVPSAAGVTATSSGSGMDVALRWALLAGLAVALGGLVGEALVRRRERRLDDAPAVETPQPWLLSASSVGLVAASGLALGAQERGDPLDSPGQVALVVQVLGFIVATLAAVRPTRWLVAVALAVVVVAEGVRSHLQVEATPFGSIVIVVHLAAAAVWIGALIHVTRAALLWRRTHRGQAGALFVEYSLMALGLYVVVLVTGTIAAILVLPSLDSLWSTTYGLVLLAKLALVAVASALAFAARRRLARPGAGLRVVRLTRVEAPALVAVLAAGAVLSSIAPPADESRALAYPPPVRGAAVRLGALAGQITVGVVASESQLELRLRVPEWDPNASYDFDIAATLTRPDGSPAPVALSPCGAGCFVGPTSWEDGGNTLALEVQSADWSGDHVTFAIPWRPEGAQALFDQMLTTMSSQPRITFVEAVTSDTTAPPGARSDELSTSGEELVNLQPYRSGVVTTPVVLGRDGEATEIGFAISAEGIYVRQRLDASGRILRETLVTPNHEIDRVYSYGAG